MLYQIFSSLQSLDITTSNTSLCLEDLPFLSSHSQEHAMALKYDTLTWVVTLPLEYYSQISIKFKRNSSPVDVSSPRRWRVESSLWSTWCLWNFEHLVYNCPCVHLFVINFDELRLTYFTINGNGSFVSKFILPFLVFPEGRKSPSWCTNHMCLGSSMYFSSFILT